MKAQKIKIAGALGMALLAGMKALHGQEQVVAVASTPATAAAPAPAAAAAAADTTAVSAPVKYYVPVPGKKGKLQYVGPKTVYVLAPTPMLDEQGLQREDPEGKPMFNPAVQQQRDKHGDPIFDQFGRPVMQTATELGFDEHGKRLKAKKEKEPKLVSLTIERGTFTVDGMAAKAGLNYEIKDLRYLYFYTPWIGTTLVSSAPFPGAKEQKNAFNDQTLTITVGEHTLQLYSDQRLLGKNPESAYVAVDRTFKLATTTPVVGYGGTLHAPYVWPGSRENAVLHGPMAPPPLPVSLRAAGITAPAPVAGKSAATTVMAANP